MKQKTGKTVVGGTSQTIIFLMLSVIVVLFFFLSNTNNDIEFKSTTIFMIVLVASYVLLLSLAATEGRGKFLRGNNVILFFQEPVTRRDLLWIPIGLFLSLGVAFAASNFIPDQTAAGLTSVVAAGVVMMGIFLRTHSILIPVLIHGSFNTAVILIGAGVFGSVALDSASIPIPEIGIPLGNTPLLFSESLFQFVLVSLSEEMFKMLAFGFALMVIKSKFDPDRFSTIAAAGFSVGIWGVYHLILAIN